MNTANQRTANYLLKINSLSFLEQFGADRQKDAEFNRGAFPLPNNVLSEPPDCAAAGKENRGGPSTTPGSVHCATAKAAGYGREESGNVLPVRTEEISKV
jgi:hypothetical protein